MMYSLDKLQLIINSLTSNRKFLVAYSGGMDSHLLLYSMVAVAKTMNYELRAAHIHHGLSKHAAKWAIHCQAIARDLGVECLVKHIDVSSQLHGKHSMEAVARELRYRELAEILQDGESLLVAHHSNDQAETLLLQMLRGAGISGLAAMPQKRKFAGGYLLRPLLSFSREELGEYAIKHNLQWVEDESNENIGIERNYIRHKLMPTIVQRWPGVLKTLGRVTKNCASAQELVNTLTTLDYQRIQGSQPKTLAISGLQNFSVARQNSVLRYWLAELQLPIPTYRQLEHIRIDVVECRKDAKPVVRWHGAEVRRYRDNLYAMPPLSPFDAGVVIAWNGKTEIELPNGLGTITPQILATLKIDLERVEKLSFCFRHRGNPPHLKKSFQKQAIPPWLRDRVPILRVKDKEGHATFHILDMTIPFNTKVW